MPPHESVLPYRAQGLVYGDSGLPELKLLMEAQLTPGMLERVKPFGKYRLEEDVRLLPEQEARDVSTLKKLLDEGAVAIPIGHAIHAPTFEAQVAAGKLKVHQGCEHLAGDGPGCLATSSGPARREGGGAAHGTK